MPTVSFGEASNMSSECCRILQRGYGARGLQLGGNSSILAWRHTHEGVRLTTASSCLFLFKISQISGLYS